MPDLARLDPAFPPVRPSRHVRATVTDDGAMLLDLRGRGRWYALPASGARWWRHLAAGATADQAAEAVAAHYRIDPTRVRADIQAMVADLLSRGLLEIVGRKRRRWWPW
ncbi:hypothetical protein LI90_2776 [Carbonactinospora thermoautotrophica]|uniref:Coenzyme PQQ synthesis protein D (PqqD) n=1 Tax=Carbonactinospora thermoautotrophica TaxID=1469144 RepID=A0A132MVA8_9ACTN|nr:PqqD family protein [Carbonactinospora thermoautotrophica]KWX01744.1 hypothetical protein LI90_2776 [Carbonactinospora thermoautotrophica]